MADKTRMAVAERLRTTEAESGMDVLWGGVRVLAGALMAMEATQHVGADADECARGRSIGSETIVSRAFNRSHAVVG